MSLDAMKKVVDAEDSARQSLQNATAEAKQIVADAEAKGRAYRESRQAEADAGVRAMMQDAEAKAADNGQEIMHHAENQCAVLRAHAESRLEQAADRIVERIVIG